MTYRIDTSESAEAEIDAAYLWISRYSPDSAARWHAGLLAAIESLSELPHRCPLARESVRFDGEVGSFVIREVPGEEPAVRIVHVRHGAQSEGGTGWGTPGGP